MDKGEDPDVWARIKNPEAGLPEKYSSEMEEDMSVPKIPIGERAVDFVKGTVEEVKEQGTRLWNELSEQARQVDEATKPLRDKLAQEADEVVDHVDDFIDKTLEKAKDLKRKEAEDNPDKDGDGIADTLPDFGKKLGEKHSDFFDKAAKWLDQQEGSRGDSGHAPDPGSTSGRKIEPLELPKDPAGDSPA